jgi:diguanylate cyclase (GGDEF)-like protein
VLGTLCVIDKVQRNLSDGQVRALRALSRQVMGQLELRRQVEGQDRYRKLLEEANSRLEVASVTDDVSGYHNTRFLHQYLDSRLGSAQTAANKLSLVFFDMDGFKQVVDTHGHLLGAKVLKEVAQAVNRELGRDDRIVRYGGDEYVVILPGQDRKGALDTTERMRQVIRSTAFLTEDGLDVRVTASFGLATYPDDAEDKRQLLLLADRCLFRSKADGKNRISCGTGESK